MSEIRKPIPARLYNATQGGHVAGAEDIFDDSKNKNQAVINSENDANFAQIDNEIEALEKQDVIPVDALPSVSEANPKAIYRVAGEDSYTDYMVNASGDGWKELAEFSFPGIDEEPTDGGGNLISSGGISKFVKKAANGIVVDYSHMLSVTEGTVSYLARNDYDCLHLTLPSDAVKVSISNAVITGRFYFFDSVEISTDSYLTSSSAGIIPVGAKIALCNCEKVSNPSYDSSEVAYDCKSDSDRGGLYDEIRYSANNFRVLLRKALNKSGDTISIIDSSTDDVLIAYLPPFAATFSVINAELTSGYFYFFNSTEASGETYIGRNNIGTVPSGAVICVTNISRSNSEGDYYKEVNTDITTKDIVAENVDYYVREKDYTLIEPDEILENKRIWNGTINDSTILDLYVYNNIDADGLYAFSGKMSSGVSSFYYVTYWDEEDKFIGYDVYKNENGVGSEYSNVKLTIPINATTIKMNVQKSYVLYYNLNTVALGAYYDFNQMEVSTNVPAPLKVVVNADKSFYVRYPIDDTNDGILVFDYLSHYNFSRNCIMINRYYTGEKEENDATILAKADYQRCADMQSPMFTENLGPLFSNHGYSTPRVVVENHGLTDDDLGSEWTDQNNYHYTIGRINGNYIYLLPVIYSTGVPGEETRQWKWYSSPYPTQLTRVGTGGETLTVESHSRWDYQISELNNVRVIINGKEVDEGTYQCEEVELAYEQIGYNPIFISTWWPSPVYNDIMLKFDRHFTVSGGKGFVSCTSDTVVNNLYPYPLRHYIDVVPQFPFQIGNYKPHIYIPKMNKVTTDIDFREEFVSVDGDHSSVSYYRNTSDLKDVNDMPDRAYSYLMTDGGDILYGCAGGHSLVRGMSVKTIRNNYIAMDGEVGIWNPGAGNKHYNNILQNMDNEENMVPNTFINEFEGYVCWYKPQNGVHAFYHKSGDSYIVYIHTKDNNNKGFAVLPDFMNGMSVKETVENTDGIALLTSIVTDGKLFFTSDNSQTEYNYLVVRLR